MTILHGDCRELLRQMPDASIDSIVTDPPYELGFMGKQWDASGVAYDVALWRECLRVLKPGGHLLAFGGTRTYHRMAVAIEDAGFEIRDSIHWLYGSGFPKSLDVSKAIDKQRHDRAEILRVTNWLADAVKASGRTHADILDAFGFNAGSGMVGHWTARTFGSQPAVPTLEQVPTLLDVLGVKADDVPDDIRRLLWDLNGKKGQPGENWAKREVVGQRLHVNGGGTSYELRHGPRVEIVAPITTPATDAARQWEGWGTALKPAHEPIVLARKPLDGTVAANVLRWGTGALNVDGARVGSDGGARRGPEDIGADAGTNAVYGVGLGLANAAPRIDGLGRWPANIVLTHAADCADDCAPGCPVQVLDQQSGVTTTSAGVLNRNTALGRLNDDGWTPTAQQVQLYGDTGGASRFFTITEWGELDVPFRYVAKPSKRERNAGLDRLPERAVHRLGAGIVEGLDPHAPAVDRNHHPTVKPVALMRWLVRLITPPGGTVLDPFLGSGTTAVAATLEGFDWVGCEMTAEYLPIIEGRVAHARAQRPALTTEPDTETVPTQQMELPL